MHQVGFSLHYYIEMRGQQNTKYLSPFILGPFAKINAAISFVISVRPPVRMEQLRPHWKDFHEI